MNAPGPGADRLVAHALLDRENRLVSADQALEALNARAGGAVGSALAVPQLATAVRLARRLGIPVTRGVVVADEENDLHLWVRAQPEGDQVRLAVSGWRELPAWQPAPEPVTRTDAEADWRWETDAGLRLTFLSIEAAATAGLDAIAALGQPLTAIFALEDSDSGALPILDALARQQPFAEQPARVRASGRRVILSAAVRRDRAGQFAGLSGTARAPSAAAIATEPALPPTFTAGLDRALRAPLARIVANADSMSAQADGPIAANYADYASDIAGAGRHLLSLVGDLVDLEAIERPGFALAIEPIDLGDVARRAAGLLAVRAANAQVRIERSSDAPVPALGDFRRALQISVNLLGNALRYSPAGATVSVDARLDGARASLVIADQGKGIAPADQLRIFEKFARIDPSDDGGNGLGLYIARRLARAMGGDVSVESAAGEGARFTFSLAAAPAPGTNNQ